MPSSFTTILLQIYTTTITAVFTAIISIITHFTPYITALITRIIPSIPQPLLHILTTFHTQTTTYAKSMQLYTLQNPPPSIQKKLKITIAELTEFVNSLHDPVHAFKEFFDIIHAWNVSFVCIFVPLEILINYPYIWYILFYTSWIVAPWKHANRYYEHGCIRSIEHCKKSDHVCSGKYGVGVQKRELFYSAEALNDE